MAPTTSNDGDNFTRHPSIALFGPQITDWTPGGLADLQSVLVDDATFGFLRQTLVQASEFWGSLAFPDVRINLEPYPFPKNESLRELCDYAAGNKSLRPENLTSVHLAPLTVVAHVVNLTRRVMSPGENGEPDWMPSFQAVQGYGIGFLTAAAVATSRHWIEFKTNCAIGLRLAVAIGAVVDAENQQHDLRDRATAISVQWRLESERIYLEALVDATPTAYVSCINDERAATITLGRRSEPDFCDRLQKAGLSIEQTGLYGRFHHDRHRNGADFLKSLCAINPELQLSGASEQILSLRSSADGEILVTGELHDIAIDSILSRRAHWYQVVASTVSNLTVDGDLRFTTFGNAALVPQTLAARYEAVAAKSDPHSRMDERGIAKSEIAIVGMACRLPKADTVEELWQVIKSGSVAVGQIPPGRFDTVDPTRQPRLPMSWGNFLRSPEVFDHRFFNISGREAKFMDPQQRLALEVAYEAVESSGYYTLRPGQQDDNIGCYLGVMEADYEQRVALEDANAFSATGTLRAFVSGRVSHFFGWTGPSMTFDTACSSSGVAIHNACKAIIAGECSAALAGGVSVITGPNLHQNLAAASFLNPNGSSKAFDIASDGYCRGEGCVIFFLKSASRAVADGDLIHGIIAASSVSHTSNSTPITQSDPQSQMKLYNRILLDAEINPKDVTYVEAHGTGTEIGDPVEFEGIQSTFTGPWREDELFLGTVKDSIGHAEAASGGASLLKCLLMMQHRIIPKQAGFTEWNPAIRVDNPTQITVPQRNMTWKFEKCFAIVNNFGASGTLVSFALRGCGEAAATSNKTALEAAPQPFPFIFSAKSRNSLNSYMLSMSHHVRSQHSIGDLAHSLTRRQNPSFKIRLAFPASSVCDLSDQLEDAIAGRVSVTEKRSKTPVVLCFGGQTGTTVGLSRTLFDSCALLREHLKLCDTQCKEIGIPSIFPTVFQETPIENLVLLHCSLFSLQYSCAQCWLGSGVEVDVLIGHSFGQLTALCVSGSIPVRDALRLISGRARLIQDHWNLDSGLMLSVEGDLNEVEAIVHAVNLQAESRVDFACYNSLNAFVVAGDSPSIAKVEEACKAKSTASRSIRTARLQNSHAYHSYLSDGILDKLKALAASIRIRKPKIPLEACSPDSRPWRYTPEDIVQHTRLPVHFSDAVQRVARRLPSAIWLEAGSASPVVTMSRRTLTGADHSTNTYIALDLRSNGALGSLCEAVCRLWSAGSDTRYWLFHPSQNRDYNISNPPPYQFEKHKHWIYYQASGRHQQGHLQASPNEGTLVNLVKKDDSEVLFSISASHPDFLLKVKGHSIAKQPVCPASLYIELAARCLVSFLGPENLPQIENLVLLAPLRLDSGEAFVSFQKATHDRSWDFSVWTKSKDGHRTDYAQGCISPTLADDPITVSRLRLLKRLARDSSHNYIMTSPQSTGLGGSMVYKVFDDFVQYEPWYRGVKRIFGLDNEAVGLVNPPPSCTTSSLDLGTTDSMSLENFLQVAGIHINCLSGHKSEEFFICSGVEEIFFSPKYVQDKSEDRSWTVHAKFSPVPGVVVSSDLFIYDVRTKELVMCLIGVTFRKMSLDAISRRGSNVSQTRMTLQSSLETQSFGKPHQGYRVGPPLDTKSLKRLDCRTDASSSASAVGSSEAIAAASSPNCQDTEPRLDRKVREMFASIMGVSLREITPTTQLEQLGIDSLLITEVLREIRQQFDVVITPKDFYSCHDLLSLCACIHLGASYQDKTPTEISQGQRPEQRLSCDELAHQSFTPSPCVDGSQSEMESSRGFATTCRTYFENVNDTYDKHAEATGYSDFYANVFPTQFKLVICYIVEAFESLGLDLRSIEAGEQVPIVSSSSKHERLVKRLYEILQIADLIALKENGQILRTATSPPTVPSSILHSTLLSNFPQHTAETKLLHLVAHRLAECLLGNEDPVDILFGSAQARALLEDVYTNSPMLKTSTLLLADYMLKVMRTYQGTDRHIQILEIGAGTGGTTKALLKALTGNSGMPRFTYTFSDISASLVNSSRRKFAMYSSVKYKVLDVEQDPTLYAKEHLHQFDIIISTNCVHATRNLVDSARNIRQLLKSNGVLCLLEMTRNLHWFDLVFGFLEGWWLATDGREYPLADEFRWKNALRTAGYHWVGWSGETMVFKKVDGIILHADVYYPPQVRKGGDENRIAPVALMIHGGGHVTLTRKYIRLDQVSMALDRGFVVVSIDYRLCPEVTLTEGPMTDTVDALAWIRNTLPKIPGKRPDVRLSGEKVVAIGWSSGRHLAMSLSWTSISRGIHPPEAILAFYCPTDYADPFWLRPNISRHTESTMAEVELDEFDDEIWSEILDQPLTGDTTSMDGKRAIPGGAGGLSIEDRRARLPLCMSRHGKTLDVFLNGRGKRTHQELVDPTSAQIATVSPLAQIRNGAYTTPTFIIHPRQDDLLPLEQSLRTHEALVAAGVKAELRIVENSAHLFDAFHGWEKDRQAFNTVLEGYRFIWNCVEQTGWD